MQDSDWDASDILCCIRVGSESREPNTHGPDTTLMVPELLQEGRRNGVEALGIQGGRDEDRVEFRACQ